MSYLIPYQSPQLTQFELDLLDLNRAIAGWIGLDGRYTLSTNISRAISDRTGVDFHTCKRWFHRGVAGFVAAMLGVLGMPVVAAIGVGALFGTWLNGRYDHWSLRQ
jgi:hypothetical protein